MTTHKQMVDVSEEELMARLSKDKKRTTICPECGRDGWHYTWCTLGDGPAPQSEAGSGYGREDTARPAASEADASATFTDQSGGVSDGGGGGSSSE